MFIVLACLLSFLRMERREGVVEGGGGGGYVVEEGEGYNRRSEDSVTMLV